MPQQLNPPAPRPPRGRPAPYRSSLSSDHPCRSVSVAAYRRRQLRSSRRPRAGPASRPSFPASLVLASLAGRDSSCSVLFYSRLIPRVQPGGKPIRLGLHGRKTLPDRGDRGSWESLEYSLNQRVPLYFVPHGAFSALFLLAQASLSRSRFR